MAEAHYFHSTLYSFGGKAVEAVIGRFRKAVDNVAVKCHYDKEQDGFELVAPQDVGPLANDALEDTIAKYMTEELDAAARDQREPQIVRFPESILDDFEGCAGEVNEVNEEGACLERQPAAAQLTPSFLHSVSVNCDGSTLKLFNLRDTGPGMLERTLVHPGVKVQEAVYRGFTCRAARWDPPEGCYSFNGRSGAEIPPKEFMPDVAFTVLHGKPEQTYMETEEAATEQEPAVTHWKFSGPVPSVNQYLDGMGKIEMLDPETAKDPSEMPSDALKYNNAPEYEVRAFGRSRRPAAGDALSADDDDSSIKDSESESDDDSSSDEDCEKAAAFAKYRNITVAQTAPTAEERSAVMMGRQLGLGSPAAVLAEQPKSSVAETSQINPQRAHIPANAAALPDYQRSFAKVDKNGLLGNAGMQAQWEHANPVPSMRKSNRHGIARRAPTNVEDTHSQPTTSESASMSLSTGHEIVGYLSSPTPGSSFSAIAPISMLEDDFYDGAESQPWAKHSSSVVVETGNLIDTSIPVVPKLANMPRSREALGRVRPPSGLERAVTKAAEVERGDAKRTHASASSKENVRLCNTSETKQKQTADTLIDFDWEEPQRTKPIDMLTWSEVPLKPTVKLPAMATFEHGEQDHVIVEKLQETANQSYGVRNTMRQHATKKKKKKKPAQGSSPSKHKVQLPMPDPPPQPKANPAGAAAQSGAPGGQSSSAGTHITQTPESHIEKLLRRVNHLHGRSDIHLQVSLGMIVVRPKDYDLCKGNWISSKLQRKLQAEEDAGNLRTDFFERLTTSEIDAAFMLGLLPGETKQPQVQYEITVRLLRGEMRTITFDQDQPDSFAVFHPEQLDVTLYMHYPIHVHDGRCRVVKSELALDVDSAKVEPFVYSMSSVQSAPSFMALVPTDTFSVERVHVKRVFTKEVVPGVEVKVEEIQDLRLDPIADNKNFNLKVAASNRPAMIDNHRLWYECSLRLAPLDTVQGGVLQQLVDKLVAEIDGVGFHNRGPYLKTEIPEAVEPVVNFW